MRLIFNIIANNDTIIMTDASFGYSPRKAVVVGTYNQDDIFVIEDQFSKRAYGRSVIEVEEKAIEAGIKYVLENKEKYTNKRVFVVNDNAKCISNILNSKKYTDELRSTANSIRQKIKAIINNNIELIVMYCPREITRPADDLTR